MAKRYGMTNFEWPAISGKVSGAAVCDRPTPTIEVHLTIDLSANSLNEEFVLLWMSEVVTLGIRVDAKEGVVVRF